MLEAARAAGGAPVVFAATGGAVYGEGEGADLPFPESTPPAPESAYGASKLAGEIYLGLYRRLHGMPGLALRFGNVYGPRQDPHGEAGVVAIFCGRLLAGEAPTVFGDGAQTRDYVFVDDVVAALLLGAEAIAGGDGPEGPLNIGTGDRDERARPARGPRCRSSGADVKPIFAEARAGEIQRVSLDASAARQALGWRPQVPLAEGLRRTFESVARHGRLSGQGAGQGASPPGNRLRSASFGEDHVALGGAVERVAGGQDESLAAGVVDDLHVLGLDDPRSRSTS